MTVKTRGRYDLVDNCIQSIRGHYPDMRIIVADEIGVDKPINNCLYMDNRYRANHIYRYMHQ